MLDGYSRGESGFDARQLQRLLDLGDAAREIVAIIDALSSTDDLLRGVRIETLDGSEPVVRKQLDANTTIFHGE